MRGLYSRSRPLPADVLALFDLDHTLLTGDCDEAWVEFLIERGVLDRASFERANRQVVDRYRRGEVGVLEFTEFYVSTLAAHALPQLENWRGEYVQQKIMPMIPFAARELVDKGIMKEEDFRDFVFTNPVRMWTALNPDFFKGTVVESAVDKLLAG